MSEELKCTAITEKEMCEYEVPQINSYDELLSFISSLVNRDHDYGTCCYAMSIASVAAFNFVAGQLGVTGFQASCADLDVLRRTRRIKGPFILLNGEDELYPQYNLETKLREARAEWVGWIGKTAKEKLQTHNKEQVHPSVWAHWKKLAKLEEK